MNMSYSFNYDGKKYFCNKEASTFDLCDLGGGVTVKAEVCEYKDYDAVHWVLYFENKSDKNSGIFSEIWDSDVLLPLDMPENPKNGYMPKEGDACIITMTGMVPGGYYWENDKVSATEYSFNYEYLDKASNKTKTFENIGCRSSEGMMPFFDVTAKGSGYIAAIGWTGDWKSVFSRRDDGILIKTGLKETCFYLKPSEKIRATSILIMKYDGGDDKHNKFRKLIKEHFSHKCHDNSKREGLLAFELWGGLTSEEMKKRISELKKHNINFEDIWIDAGWYGNCTKCDDAFSGDWSVHTGEWEVNKHVHPGELRDVSDCAKDAGMHLMLWLEPERAMDGTRMSKEHPEWFLEKAGSKSKILNYGNEDAAEYVLNMLCEYVEKLDLSCYRQDFNTQLTEYFKNADKENRRGITEIKHIMGMYKMWDALIAKFPHLLIDNCASGGRRIDIETMKRSIPFFRSDYQCNFNENSEVLQTHNSGISCYLPYNGCTSKTKSDTYAIRSSYSSSWGGAFYNAIFQSFDEEDFKWAKRIVDEYKKIRHYFSCDFYNLGSSVFDDTSWAIWQYHDPDTNKGIVMAFRRSNSPFDRVTIELRGIENGKVCQISSLDDPDFKAETNNLEIILPEKRTSVIFEYEVK